MHKQATLMAIFVALLALSPRMSTAQEAIHWEPTLEAAQQLAARNNRLLLIHFWATTCAPCRRMEAEVLSQPSLAPIVAGNYVAVKINADHFPTTARQFGVTAVPTTIIATPQGQPIDVTRGRMELADFSARLTQVAAVKQSGTAAYAQIPGMTPPTMAPSSPPPGASQPVVGAQGLPAMTNPPSANLVGPSLDRTAVAAQPSMPATPGPATTPPNNNPTDNRYSDYFRRQTQPVTPIAQPQSAMSSGVNVPSPAAYPPSNPMAAANNPIPSPQSGVMPSRPSMTASGSAFGQPAMPSPTMAAGPAAFPALGQRPFGAPPGNAVIPSPAANAAAPPPVFNPPLALDGFCPVVLGERQQWLVGDRRWGVVHRGRTYLFSSPDAQKSFLKDPDRYAPAISGNDVVMAAEQGQAVPGMREHGVFFGTRVYLFSSETNLEKFWRNPALYASQALRTGSYAGASLQ